MNEQREVLRSLLVETHQAVGQVDTKARRVIDARGKVLMRIDTSRHLCQTIFRGQADDLELLDWLNNRVLPLESAHDPESIYYSALLGIGEMFSAGTTAIIDMESVHYTDSAFEAIIQSGMRAVSGKCMIDHGEGIPKGLKEKTADSLQESVDLLEMARQSAVRTMPSTPVCRILQ